MFEHYILDEDHNLVTADWMESAKWREDNWASHCVVGKTYIADREISTVFLGSRHLGGIFETAVFGGANERMIVQRYETWEEAAAGHLYWVASVQKELNG